MKNKKSSYRSRASTGNPHQLRVMIPIKTYTKITKIIATWFIQTHFLKNKSPKRAENVELQGLRFPIAVLQMKDVKAKIDNIKRMAIINYQAV